MTTITLNRKEVEKHIGKLDDKLQERIVLSGVEIDSLNDEEISVDITPNRTDLLSTQGFVRYVKNYLGKGKLSEYKIKNSNYEVVIEKSVKEVRPLTVCAVVKNLKLDDQRIKDIIDIQEKLHQTIGRKRKRMAMGVYPLEKLKFPVRFIAKKPSEIKFRPLEYPTEITGAQILRQHPAGRDYANLLEGLDKYPIFVDANEQILSMPPIINSHETGKIDEKTKEVFVECSGFNKHYLEKSLNILVSALADMGAEIYSVKIKDKTNSVSPNLERQKIEFEVEDVNRTLGLELKEKEIENLLKKMDVGMKKEGKKLLALVPAYRTDVLHWVDIAEDVAIAYGYENFIPEIPKISTIAEEDKTAIKKRVIGNILAGIGFIEASSLHLNTKEEIKKMHYQFNDFIEVEDSKTEYNVLRMDLLTNLMKIFSENSDSSYPQKIFEMGRAFELNSKTETGIKEKEMLSIAICEEKTDFTEIKKVLDYLFKMLGKNYEIQETENSNFIPGRVGKILVDKKEVGLIGEISPRCLKNWKVDFPVVAVEMGLEGLS
jgi:phenylalanyl-tRNA synthetase beta chain